MAANGGIKISLLMGIAPLPVPSMVVEALSSVKIDAGSSDSQSGFELTFDLSARSPVHTLFLLASGTTTPVVRVIMMVQIGGLIEPLIDGVVTNVETMPGTGGVTQLVVKGKDMSAMMDIDEVKGRSYPAMSPHIRVLSILKDYEGLGIFPIVIPSPVDYIPLPTAQIPQHDGTDYEYLKDLAFKCGYVFHVQPSPAPGASIAYWGPEIRVGIPQAALSVNMDAITNVEDLKFNFDKEKVKYAPFVYVQNPANMKTEALPLPDTRGVTVPLGLVPPLPRRVSYLRNTAHMAPPNAYMYGIAMARQHNDSVFGSGSLDVSRYGRVLKSRQLVGVRGAGLVFDGLYYVQTVTHDIKRGEYKQTFTLARNGLLPTVPLVRV